MHVERLTQKGRKRVQIIGEPISGRRPPQDESRNKAHTRRNGGPLNYCVVLHESCAKIERQARYRVGASGYSLTPLRTVRESFRSHGSSLSKDAPRPEHPGNLLDLVSIARLVLRPRRWTGQPFHREAFLRSSRIVGEGQRIVIGVSKPGRSRTAWSSPNAWHPRWQTGDDHNYVPYGTQNCTHTTPQSATP